MGYQKINDTQMWVEIMLWFGFHSTDIRSEELNVTSGVTVEYEKKQLKFFNHSDVEVQEYVDLSIWLIISSISAYNIR